MAKQMRSTNIPGNLLNNYSWTVAIKNAILPIEIEFFRKFFKLVFLSAIANGEVFRSIQRMINDGKTFGSNPDHAEKNCSILQKKIGIKILEK